MRPGREQIPSGDVHHIYERQHDRQLLCGYDTTASGSAMHSVWSSQEDTSGSSPRRAR